MADPGLLTADEERKALAVAGRDDRLAALLRGRNAPIFVRPVGDRRQAAGARHALVGFYDYEANRSVVAVVDTAAGRVEAVEQTQVSFQLSGAEAREAEALAEAEPEIVRLLAGRPLNPLTRLYFPPWIDRHDPPHRYAIVFARPSNADRRYAIVDLSERDVVEVLGPNQLARQ